MTSFIEYLKKDPDCLYIYNQDLSIYGLPQKERYIIIVIDNWVCPEEWIGFDSNIYQFFKISDWFNMVLNNNLTCWKCSCLNKKYIIKEHVKLMIIPNPLKLRKEIDLEYSNLQYSSIFSIEIVYRLILDILFSIQIIQNHKIVNYKEGLNYYEALQNVNSNSECWEMINKVYDELKSLTDGMVKQERLKKLKINEDF